MVGDSETALVFVVRREGDAKLMVTRAKERRIALTTGLMPFHAFCLDCCRILSGRNISGPRGSQELRAASVGKSSCELTGGILCS